eukprot:2794376-Prymnesium_polylepis.1
MPWSRRGISRASHHELVAPWWSLLPARKTDGRTAHRELMRVIGGCPVWKARDYVGARFGTCFMRVFP